jgi:hypothetical protein
VIGPRSPRGGDINEAMIALGLVLQLEQGDAAIYSGGLPFPAAMQDTLRQRACRNDRNGMRSAALLHLDGDHSPQCAPPFRLRVVRQSRSFFIFTS